MAVKIIEEVKTRLVAELEGEDHTLANLLSKELEQDDEVRFAGYTQDHPIYSNPQIVVEVSPGGKSARDALNDAVKSLKKTVADMKKQASALK